jgi:CheY-like chemotaxis protein
MSSCGLTTRIERIPSGPYTNLLLLRAVLARAADLHVRNAVVTEARSLAAAYAALAATNHDLVILDVRLPDGDGLDVARLVRDRDPTRRPRILILSASVLAGERETALASGGDRLLAKPYLPAALQAACAELI